MIGYKTKMLAAIIFGALSALLLAEATFILFPAEELSMPLPLPQANSATQLLWSLHWLGVSVFVSALIVGAILGLRRAIQPKIKTNQP